MKPTGKAEWKCLAKISAHFRVVTVFCVFNYSILGKPNAKRQLEKNCF